MKRKTMPLLLCLLKKIKKNQAVPSRRLKVRCESISDLGSAEDISEFTEDAVATEEK